jgi:hypothetical protein
MSLDRSKIGKWKDLAKAILLQYKFNIDMELDSLRLQAMKKKRKWVNKRIRSILKENNGSHSFSSLRKRIGFYFMNTFKSLFYECLLGNGSASFV